VLDDVDVVVVVVVDILVEEMIPIVAKTIHSSTISLSVPDRLYSPDFRVVVVVVDDGDGDADDVGDDSIELLVVVFMLVPST
jgi:hypothetical protein